MRILLVEDDTLLRGQLRGALQEAGYSVDEASNGRVAQFMGETEPFDAVVLDLGLPEVDGITVLRRWRESGRNMPVLILTARDNWHEKVSGIDAGADDYLTKPFHLEELLARLRALIRRASGQASAVLQCGDLSLDTRTARVACAGQAIPLTAHEYKVLAYLMHRPDQLVSRTELTEHIYAQDFDRDSNTIEVFVGRLRKKLHGSDKGSGVCAEGCPRIETLRGLGYRLVPP
ncbi:response regulator [Acidovorax sp. RAC01]|uniref:response regulator n=1 Tax=Acidovorax sp. RAC01 TaxID=1842533 RepID=UPI00083E81E7|nr:response regulator transcription factor [Acidovorax sp. RAC01]AOG24333.1 hypothetical protein BSY15_2962 [Acidovorax sp. RAC01]